MKRKQLAPIRVSRMRRTKALRALVREVVVRPQQLILPVFVTEVEDVVTEIAAMPDVMRWQVEHLAGVAGQVTDARIGGILLFGIPRVKDALGSPASDAEGVIQRAVRSLRESHFEGVIITDVCLCEYTDHGHCGILSEEGAILGEPTLERLAEIAVSHAGAGADMVAPSAMMDGQVGAIRSALDTSGFLETPILSYSAKYASAYYGPFREAADGAPLFGDRRSHQMDPANRGEALREHALDIAEGADFLMVKPGLAYLDIIRDTRNEFPEYPLAAYNVSGEYSMVKAAARNGWIDERAVVLETLIGFRRAGADLIITYHALDAARWLAESSEPSQSRNTSCEELPVE